MDLAPIKHVRNTGHFCRLGGVVKVLPRFAQLTGLEFWQLYGYRAPMMRRLLDSPHLANLRTLILHLDRNGNRIDDDILIEGVTSPIRSNLTELMVNTDGSWGLRAPVVRAIATCPHLGRLTKLSLAGARLDRAAVEALTNSRYLTRLTDLDMAWVMLPADLWEAVLHSRNLAGLRWLRLYHAYLEGTGENHRLDELPSWRATFEERFGSGVVDWDTDLIYPVPEGWSMPRCPRCWQGHTWKK
jgi:hypothetical protein